jgi:hypothetical protein
MAGGFIPEWWATSSGIRTRVGRKFAKFANFALGVLYLLIPDRLTPRALK